MGGDGSVSGMSASWLRPVSEDDTPALHRIFGDPECMRYWHRPVSASMEDTVEVVRELLGRGEWTWAIGATGEDAAQADALGFVSFVHHPRPGAIVGFGYAIRRDAWGRGLTVDACRQALGRGFDDAAIAGVELWIHARNRRSRRLAEKLGATVRTETVLNYERGSAPAVIYGLSAETWRTGEPDVPTTYAVEPVLVVSDVAAAAGWWRDTLGFVATLTIGAPPVLVMVAPAPGWSGAPGVHLRAAATDADADAIGRSTIVIGAGLDVETQAQRAVDAGARVLTPFGRRPWGLLELELADPDGNRVRLTAPSTAG
jgi:[ribosomal protein S5]-alanine N-acetyltransferase